MARTYRRKGQSPKRDEKNPGFTYGRGPDRFLDKDIQRLPPRSARTDGISVKPDWDDERGGHTMSKAQRLTKRGQIQEGLDQ